MPIFDKDYLSAPTQAKIVKTTPCLLFVTLHSIQTLKKMQSLES